ncbi:hypothetical protein DITRI_Ditri14bG0104200 [Diplodiscus trichospermus]
MVHVESKMKISSIVRVKHGGDFTSKIIAYLDDDMDTTESSIDGHDKEDEAQEVEKSIPLEEDNVYQSKNGGMRIAS